MLPLHVVSVFDSSATWSNFRYFLCWKSKMTKTVSCVLWIKTFLINLVCFFFYLNHVFFYCCVLFIQLYWLRNKETKTYRQLVNNYPCFFSSDRFIIKSCDKCEHLVTFLFCNEWFLPSSLKAHRPVCQWPYHRVHLWQVSSHYEEQKSCKNQLKWLFNEEEILLLTNTYVEQLRFVFCFKSCKSQGFHLMFNASPSSGSCPNQHVWK